MTHRAEPATSRTRSPWWRTAALAIVIVVTGSTIAILGLRWAITEFDEAMLGQHTRESVDGATRMAERMGLVLVDGDNVVYGEVTSAFPDSSAYLVITTPSADRLTQLLSRSQFPSPTPISPAAVATRSQHDHGPAASSTLVRSERWHSGDYLTAVWDPVRDPRTVHISAAET